MSVAPDLTKEEADALQNAPQTLTFASHPGSPVLKWANFTYTVNDGAKTILNNCSGHINAGDVCAILGPSGSGKTTLLDVLAHRVDATKRGRSLTGNVSARVSVHDS